MKPFNQKGVTLVELLIATGILSIMAASVMSARYYTARQTVRNSDKAFATQKCIQMIEELKVLVNGQERLGGSTLLSYADGSAVYPPQLTTDSVVTNPADPLSQNVAFGTGWKFLRHIDIAGLPSDPNGSIVTVRVYRTSDGVTRGEELSSITTVLRSLSSTFPPTQVLDVYILTLANVPGWWSQIATMRPTFDKILASLQVENPGLEIRTHYITRTAFGRDPLYRPYTNKTVASNTFTMPYLYFYPGLVPSDGGGTALFYNPDLLVGSGNVNLDGSFQNSSSQFPGCPSYTMSDMNNHAVRYPDELTLYKAVTQAASVAGEPLPEMSLRMLMEGMNSQPASFTNSLIVNLHGELLPMPSMRNYSDPAKDPATSPNWRVVTHAEQLQYPSSGGVNLRVYGYLDGLTAPQSIDGFSASVSAPVISLILPDVTIASANSITVVAIDGGAGVTYRPVTLMSGVASPSSGMSWTLSNVSAIGGGPATQTLINLYNTPLRCPMGSNNTGLSIAHRLYGLEYIPCPIMGNSFSPDDLTKNTANQPKNTARWIISLPAGPFVMTDGQHAVETRIGAYPPVFSSSPSNFSRTFVWLGIQPPFTERSQYVGDPRHCPYLDLHNVSGQYAGRYNWYFRRIPSSSGWSGDMNTRTANGWGNAQNLSGIHVDMPRLFQTYRNGLLGAHAIWTTMNGVSYFYYGMGGEIGGNQPPFSGGISMNLTPWNTSTVATVGGIEEILTQNWGTATTRNARIASKTDNSWHAKAWLGEIYPDNAYGQWQTNGNIQTAGGSLTGGTFYRRHYANIAPAGPVTANNGFGVTWGNSNDYAGAPSFMNGTGSGSNPFTHNSTGTTGTIQQLGLDTYYQSYFPMASPVNCTRPWGFTTATGGNPPEWNVNPYNSTRTALTVPIIGSTSRIFYNSNVGSPWNGVGAVRMTSGADAGYFIISGLAPQANFGTYELGKAAIVLMLRTFLDGGLYTAGSHITQLPLVTMENPAQAAQLANPTSLPVSWTTAWQRWGGNTYTQEYPIPYTADAGVTIQYNLKYSQDNGTTWYNASDNTPTFIGRYDAAHLVASSPVTWNLSDATQFPRGNVMLRVEGYRPNMPTHYSYHQSNLYINR